MAKHRSTWQQLFAILDELGVTLPKDMSRKEDTQRFIDQTRRKARTGPPTTQQLDHARALDIVIEPGATSAELTDIICKTLDVLAATAWRSNPALRRGKIIRYKKSPGEVGLPYRIAHISKPHDGPFKVILEPIKRGIKGYKRLNVRLLTIKDVVEYDTDDLRAFLEEE